MLLRSSLGFLRPAFTLDSGKRHRSRRRTAYRLHLERLEDRHCPSGGHLLVTSFDTDSILRYDEATGAFVDTFVPRHSGGLNQPYGVVFGPHDHNLYASTGGQTGGPGQLKSVLRYDGSTGRFIDEFTERDHLVSPRGVVFGPDGNLYVADRPGVGQGRVVRFHGQTGAYMNDFVPTSSGGLTGPGGLVFGPSGKNPGKLDLYVVSLRTGILRYDGTTGAFLGEFVPHGSGGLDHGAGLTFGPDGNLYVANFAQGAGNMAVLRFEGPSGRTPGAPMPSAGNSGADFVPAGSGGLLTPFGLLFGPDGNRDGQQDLYVTSTATDGASFNGKHSTVKRYDGVTGAFIDTFVTEGNGLDDPSLMTFTETDPATLAYIGGSLMAASVAAEPVNETLKAEQVQPVLTEAFARWQGSGADASGLNSIEVRIADLPGAILGQASGHTIWLDDNAAGWGWFVDPTPWDDAEFTTPGNQGEQGKMDLLTALAHEIGHLLGKDHEADGLMAETLAAATRHIPGLDSSSIDSAALDWLSANNKAAKRIYGSPGSPVGSGRRR